jgi:hypothetical protein
VLCIPVDSQLCSDIDRGISTPSSPKSLKLDDLVKLLGCSCRGASVSVGAASATAEAGLGSVMGDVEASGVGMEMSPSYRCDTAGTGLSVEGEFSADPIVVMLWRLK